MTRPEKNFFYGFRFVHVNLFKEHVKNKHIGNMTVNLFLAYIFMFKEEKKQRVVFNLN